MRGGVDSRSGKRSPESLDFIRAALDKGANPNVQLAFKEPSRGGRDNRFRDDLLTTGATPLIRAAQTFDTEVVRLLLDHGALVDLPNASGVTPFMAASGIGTRMTSGVLGAGPPENVIALSLETMEMLRKAGADVNARITDVTSLTGRIARTNTMTDRQGQTALFLAAELGRTEVVKVPVRSRREDGREGRHGPEGDRPRRERLACSERRSFRGDRDPAQASGRYDVAIIGAGIAGLAASVLLRNAGLRVVLRVRAGIHNTKSVSHSIGRVPACSDVSVSIPMHS